MASKKRGQVNEWLERTIKGNLKFRDLLDKYEISSDMAKHLQSLSEYKTCFIFDDSGSMNDPIKGDTQSRNAVGKALSRFEHKQNHKTRWDELKYFAQIAIEICSVFNPEGSSVYFLNKELPIHNVKTASQLESIFNFTPQGWTPLPKVLDKVQKEKARDLKNKKLLIIICTDGEPTDNNGNKQVAQFKQSLLKAESQIYTTIVACTDDEEAVGYLNKWDREIPRLDIVDDYYSESREVKAVKGASFEFSFGDYVVKALSPSLDDLDEIPLISVAR